ncbi:hypothetical protein D3C75_544180 [compost metagenome]
MAAMVLEGSRLWKRVNGSMKLKYYTKADTDGPVTVGEILAEEFLKPLNMSHDELAQAMGGSLKDVGDIICGQRRLRMMRLAFLLTYLGLMRISGAICRCYNIARKHDGSNPSVATSYIMTSFAPQVS